MLRKNLLCFPLCLLTQVLSQGHHWQELGSILFASSLLLSFCILPPPGLWAIWSQLFQAFLLGEVLLSIIFFCPLLDFLQHVCVSYVLGSPGLDRELQMCVTSAELRDRITCLFSCRRANIYFKIYLNHYS